MHNFVGVSGYRTTHVAGLWEIEQILIYSGPGLLGSTYVTIGEQVV